jgi:hypothetical protein
MDNLSEIALRKAQLKAKMEQQRLDLKETFLEIKEEIEPANLLKKAVSGALGFKPKNENSSLLDSLPRPIGILADIFIKDPKISLLTKIVAPLAMQYLPKRKTKEERALAAFKENKPRIPFKIKLYGGILRGISALRERLNGKNQF